MDGRDIGTVVFPHAQLKVFLTASVEERARRRFEELKVKGETVSLEDLKKRISERDRLDETRAISPLKRQMMQCSLILHRCPFRKSRKQSCPWLKGEMNLMWYRFVQLLFRVLFSIFSVWRPLAAKTFLTKDLLSSLPIMSVSLILL